MDEWTLNDLLECSVCLERLDTSSKVLPCQHTFCKKCLEEIVSTHKELRCPECRVLVDAKIDELPPNVLLMRILEGMRNAAPKKRSPGPNRLQGGSVAPMPTHQMLPPPQQQMAPLVHSCPKQVQPPQPCARAIYDYIAKEPGDLSFKKGDMILLRKKIDSNWYHGEIGGHFGAFPLTYVQVITPLPNHIPQCKALYDFRMTNDDDEGCLTFNKGEVITVLRRIDENWAEGRLADRIGIFPLAFVELNVVARALMKLSANSQPGPSRVAPPTPTSEDTTPLIPTDPRGSAPAAPAPCSTSPRSVGQQHQPPPPLRPSAAPPPPPPPTTAPTATTTATTTTTTTTVSESSSSGSTASSSSSSTTTPNTSSSNTSSGSSTAPSSPTSPPPPRPAPGVASTPSHHHHHHHHHSHHPASQPPPQQPQPQQQRDKRFSLGALIAAHRPPPANRHSAEILSPGDGAAAGEAADAPSGELAQDGGAPGATGRPQRPSQPQPQPQPQQVAMQMQGQGGGGGAGAELFLLQRQSSKRHRRTASGGDKLASAAAAGAVAAPSPPQAVGMAASVAAAAHLPAAYIALYPYKPQKADELELKKGGIYLVTERCEDGWFKGTSNRTQKCGVFPGNYVTPANSCTPPAQLSQLRAAITRVSTPSSCPPTSSAGPASPRASSAGIIGTPPLEPRIASSVSSSSPYARSKPSTLSTLMPYNPRQHNGVGNQQLQPPPPELPPRAASPSHSSLTIMSWHSQPAGVVASSSVGAVPDVAAVGSCAPTSAAPLGRSLSAVLGQGLAGAVAPPPNASVSTASASRDKGKEKKDKAVSLMRRLTSIKKSKSPPPATYSMDNPVFEDSTVTASPVHPSHPVHPVHVRSGSCPSQLLQALPLDATSAHHRLFGSGSQRLKHKDRPNVVANLAHFGRTGDPAPVACSSASNHRKSNSLDAGSGDAVRKVNKQLVPPAHEKFRCIVPYPPMSDHELELRVGDIIYVLKKRDDGWYKGTQQRTGRTGLFPASFVESI